MKVGSCSLILQGSCGAMNIQYDCSSGCIQKRDFGSDLERVGDWFRHYWGIQGFIISGYLFARKSSVVSLEFEILSN